MVPSVSVSRHGLVIPFVGLLTFHHLGSEKELLDLVLGQGWLVRGNHKEPASQTRHYG